MKEPSVASEVIYRSRSNRSAMVEVRPAAPGPLRLIFFALVCLWLMWIVIGLLGC